LHDQQSIRTTVVTGFISEQSGWPASLPWTQNKYDIADVTAWASSHSQRIRKSRTALPVISGPNLATTTVTAKEQPTHLLAVCCNL